MVVLMIMIMLILIVVIVLMGFKGWGDRARLRGLG
jgi:type II secretory pathway pseudopilin PulG